MICRACGNETLETVFDLGHQFLANDFCGPDDEQAGSAPLKMLFCVKCALGQLSVVVKPEILYSHYHYVTSKSETMKAHFKAFVADLEKEKNGTLGDVLEIGSNDGTLLKFIEDNHSSTFVLGIDPSKNLGEIAGQENEVSTICAPFNEQEAVLLGKFDTIIARHVFAHVADWHDFIRGLEYVTHEDSLIAIEVPYLMDMILNNSFDQIYHEHLSYISITAMEKAFENSSFYVHNVIKYPIHGGAICFFLKHRSKQQVEGNTEWMKHFNFESNLSLSQYKRTWDNFSDRSNFNIEVLKNFVTVMKSHSTFAGFGASAKSSVWIQACGFNGGQIDFITDNTPHKVGKFSPGTNIPIVNEEALMRLKPDYCIIFAWNYRSEIIKKLQPYMEAVGKLIFPVPKFESVQK